MPKENSYEEALNRQDNKLKLALGARLLLGSKLFSSRPMPSLLVLGTAVVLGETFVRFGVHEEYKKAVKAGEEDSYAGPFTVPESKEVTQAAADLYQDGKQLYGFFKHVSDRVDSNQALKKFYPKPLVKEKPESGRSWWPWS